MNTPVLTPISNPPAAPAENIAATLARELPKPFVALVQGADEDVVHVAVPKTYQLQAIDREPLLAHPRRIKASAALSDTASFVAYVQRHAGAGSVVWCHFDPQSFALDFTAVFDEHAGASADAAQRPGWRSHRAAFRPAMSAEWSAWKGSDKKAMTQPEFAEWIESHEPDIAAADGYPTSLQMHGMAVEFEARQDQRLKSSIRLQSGGVALEYVADDDAGTIERMKVFERFRIGIPVFWAGAAYAIDARLRYRVNAGAVKFWYELQRPDRVHEAAAKDLIEQVRAGIGGVPMLMGACG